jgi:drug/metabolite transporter (DMT)-like permease
MSGSRHGPSASDYALLLLLGLTFGSTYLFIAVALQTIAPITVAALRGVLGFVALIGLTAIFGHELPRGWRTWRSLVVIGFFGGALPFVLMSYGQSHIDSSLASIIITIMPLFTLALAHFLTDDRASPRKLAGVVIGFMGILLLLGPAALHGQSSSVLGQLLYVGVALSYAFMGVMIRRLGASSGTALSRTACSNGIATAMLIPLAFLVEQPLAMSPSAHSLLAVLALGFISSAVGQFLVFRLNATAGPNFAAANNYLGPPVGIMWGAVLLGEEVTPLRIAAMLVIFAGIAFATTRTGVMRQATR